MTTIPLLHTVRDAVAWLRERVTGDLQTDSRQVRPGDGFIAWPGAATDGRAHVGDAIARGAAACLVENEGLDAFALPQGLPVAALHGLKAATGPIAAEWFGHPTQSLDVLAVTGTNGKTSTSWWLAEALNLLSKTELHAQSGCALVGTLGMGVPPALVSTGMTTPDPVRLQRGFRQFADAGRTACAIEASSIGLAEHRLAGSRIRVALFTNFTQDHLDYHPGMAAYWQAKSMLFDWPGLQAAVVNTDDPRGAELHAALEGRGLDVWSVSITGPARLAARDIAMGDSGLVFTVAEGAHRYVLQTNVVGHYNVSNLLGVLAALRALGIPLEHALYACAQLSPVPGRMEQIANPGQPLVAVDYAHTPDALDKALQALRPVAQQRGGRLWCVFGCGGARDAGKRPLMGAVAQHRADQVIVTSDNPRHEDPVAIVHQVLQGTIAATHVRAEPDRAAAIALALAEAGARDVVLIAGKGHEDYQEAAGQRLPFSDMAHARAALARRALTLAQAHALVQARIPAARLVGDGTVALGRVHTDTRTLQAGDLFVALKGERFDANAFLADARAAGAVAALAHGGLQAAGLPGIEVPDTLAALGALAAGWRAQFRLPLIGVTGSNGKTTVTQMIASILRAWQGDAAFATQGNFNNDIGVPLMLLRLSAAHAAAVIEMGMNHPGEIAQLAAMAQPTVALVNNAQREHLEFMHTVEAVARENGSVFASLPAGGVAVFPAGDAYAGLWRSLAEGRRVLTFGEGGDVACTQAAWEQGAWAVAMATPQGAVATRLHIAGRHNVTNALAAAACALAAGAPLAAIARGLDAFTPVKGRSRAFSVGRITVVDDTYNANPDSVRAAIDVLADLPGPRLLVLGDMGEVGDQGPQFHAEAGAHAQARGIEQVFALGALCAHVAGARHFDDMASLIAAVRAALPAVGSVLVKGSRFMKMEQVVQAIETDGGEAACS
ncbi:MAG: bifunctional UDP-N-acetylmuramoyl-L-alanyl-D-glutamate--2,6-diaminopimelate ligase MurE/UDP-N-acetylmuramoyl-tripeptide--D-alanyl-D-alanine ligase MurF [Acidovorax sp.]|uniref:bifunctional UDP-N-acetylmuramoyl-L-alanyl-D-glutamate--2, 6-diaminopimelate ligase MurE/UDP-N-acetylmuramoyl-tripeptide--D-alanyl-D-alanine ligase MurF n=1 Tax=Acidovorax sp. TaxID=1872122 RepID=UPI0039E54A33